MASLSYGRYGKDNVRLYKREINPDGTQDVVELTVCSLLSGQELTTSWSTGDNSKVVPTDTQKQTAYIVAKQMPVTPIEVYAAALAQHYIDTYSWIQGANVKVIQHRWARLSVDGKPHPHSFYRDGAEIRVVEVQATEGQGLLIKSGLDKLLVLKSTGSAFYDFHKDDFTILKDTKDRILSTEVAAGWQWKLFPSLDAVKAQTEEFNRAFDAGRKITIETFATDNSASVQNTMYKMSEQILAEVPGVEHVNYSLPNKHYFEIGR